MEIQTFKIFSACGMPENIYNNLRQDAGYDSYYKYEVESIEAHDKLSDYLVSEGAVVGEVVLINCDW